MTEKPLPSSNERNPNITIIVGDNQSPQAPVSQNKTELTILELLKAFLARLLRIQAK